MSPRMVEHVDRVGRAAAEQVGLPEPSPPVSMLTQETVLMTVLAQDPLVTDRHGPARARIPVPAERLQRGPRGHRLHVVDVAIGSNKAFPPVVLHADGDPWAYVDRWSDQAHPDALTLAGDRDFRAQNLYAVAAHTLALFERHLGRPIPWHSGSPHLYLVPHAFVQPNAFYSREHNAVLFGWFPQVVRQPALYTALSYDVVAHEVSHAVLDGLRPRFTEPGLPDQLAFHEALADLVAMLSVFGLDGVAEALLDPDDTGVVHFTADRAARRIADPTRRRAALQAGRAEQLEEGPLTLLAEQLGSRAPHGSPGRNGGYPALRRSVDVPATPAWKDDPQFAEPHRRAEVLVAAFLQTLVAIWAGRLEPLRSDRGDLDAARVAEEGTKAAGHLLGMLLRALDYLPPVELEFGDVLDAVLTADRRLAPDDDRGYRDVLETAFGAFGITAPLHRIVDEDGVATDPAAPDEPPLAAYPPDPDAGTETRLRYEHLNLATLRTSPEAVYRFVWNNAAVLGIDVRLPTRVERVLSSTRVGPDGLVVTEVLADYTQTLRATAGTLPPGIPAPAGMPADQEVELWGGGVLVFDQFGRFRLHQRQPILDVDRQTRRLQYLFDHGVRGRDGSFGASDGLGDKRRFALLHEEPDA